VLGRSGRARPSRLHISDYGLPAIIYVDVLDADMLVSAVSRFQLGGLRFSMPLATADIAAYRRGRIRFARRLGRVLSNLGSVAIGGSPPRGYCVVAVGAAVLSTVTFLPIAVRV
jgi:hypothetical protein